ncbi:MAG: molybdopterin-dependent oxidoreductase, partial [Opitutae bacterium]|nr:molybdopterin-dependent oxidoreductase [Opitutae bacterium]
IRFSKEVAHDDVLGFIDRGSYSTLTCYPGRKLENNYSLNTVDICPVGALTSTDFRFKMRVWFLKQTPSLDTESSVGANTEVWSREGVVYRITPRRNDEVNDTWMSDSGRLLYQQVKSADRLTSPTINGAPTASEIALKAAADLLVGRSVPAEPSFSRGAAHPAGSPYLAIVASGRSSVEEQFLAKQLADALKVSASLVSRVGEGDGILVSADRNPNVRGALVVGLISTLPKVEKTGNAVPRPHSTPNGDGAPSPRSVHRDEGVAAPASIRTGGLESLAADIDAGRVQTVLSVGEDLVAAGLTAAQLAKVAVIYLGTHRNATSAAARVVIPTLTVFEKSGTMVNQQFRLQKFSKAVPGPAGVSDDLVTLSQLLAAVGGQTLSSDLGKLWTTLSAEAKALAGLSYATLPATGQVLDASAWSGLPFVEGETLHFKPAAVPAAASF